MLNSIITVLIILNKFSITSILFVHENVSRRAHNNTSNFHSSGSKQTRLETVFQVESDHRLNLPIFQLKYKRPPRPCHPANSSRPVNFSFGPQKYQKMSEKALNDIISMFLLCLFYL